MRNLMFGVCIAPYRIDLYNYLYTHFNCEIYFQYEDMILPSNPQLSSSASFLRLNVLSSLN